MNETLVLLMLGLSIWLALRAARKKTAGSAILALCVIVLSFYTRLAIIPALLAVAWFMLFYVKKRKPALFWAGIVFAICTFFASWHSYTQLKTYAPFGFKEMNQFYFFSGSRVFSVRTPQGLIGFSSPSFHYPIGSPFFQYESYRKENIANARIDPAKGIEDWNREIDRIKEGYDLEKFINNLQDNAVFIAFANSWPDSTNVRSYNILLYMNFHARWLWLPMMILLLVATPFTRATRTEMLVLCCAYGLLLSLVFQQHVMLEGRYRKPLEPLLIISSYIILRNKTLPVIRRLPKLVRAHQFIREVYLRPIYRFITLK